MKNLILGLLMIISIKVSAQQVYTYQNSLFTETCISNVITKTYKKGDFKVTFGDKFGSFEDNSFEIIKFKIAEKEEVEGSNIIYYSGFYSDKDDENYQYFVEFLINNINNSLFIRFSECEDIYMTIK